MPALNKSDVGHEDANPITQMIWANTFMLIVLAVPSLTVMVLLRRKIGYRTIQPWMLLIAFCALAAMGGWSLVAGSFGSSGGVGNYLMIAVAFAVTALAIIQRRSAWSSIKRGQRWHTKSRGISYLSALPFPEHIVQRFIEPAVCFVVGLLLLVTLSKMAGLWLIFSGLCLAVLEAIIYDIQLNNLLDQLDGMVEAEVAAENQEFFTQDKAKEAPSIEQMSGITVGFAPELNQLVAKRRAAKAARAGQGTPPPDSPATVTAAA